MEYNSFVGKRTRGQQQHRESVGVSSRKQRRLKRCGGVWKRSDAPDSDPDFIILSNGDQNRVKRREEVGSNPFGEAPSCANPSGESRSVFFDELVCGDDVGPSAAAEDDDDDDVDFYVKVWNRKSESKKPLFGETSKKLKGSTFNGVSSGGSKKKNQWDLDSEEKGDFDSFETRVFRDLGKILNKTVVVESSRGLSKTRVQFELEDDDDPKARVTDDSGFGAFSDHESHVLSSSSSGTDSSKSLVKSSSDKEEVGPEENELIVENPPSKTSEKVEKKALEEEDHNHSDFGANCSENGQVNAKISVVVSKITSTEMGNVENGENIENGVQYCARVGDKTTIVEEEVENMNLGDKKEVSKVDEERPDDEDDQNHDHGENVNVGIVTGRVKTVIPESPSSPIKIRKESSNSGSINAEINAVSPKITITKMGRVENGENGVQYLAPKDKTIDSSDAIFEKREGSAKTVDEPSLPLKYFFGAVEPQLVEKLEYENLYAELVEKSEYENLYADLDLSLPYEDIGSSFLLPFEAEDEEFDDPKNKVDRSHSLQSEDIGSSFLSPYEIEDEEFDVSKNKEFCSNAKHADGDTGPSVHNVLYELTCRKKVRPAKLWLGDNIITLTLG